MKKFVLLALAFFSCCLLQAQYSSLSTDANVLRSFTKGSKFWAFGQTVRGEYHLTEKTAAYAWVSYYTTGRFKNNLSALAKDSAISPQQVQFRTASSLRFRQISLGMRHYFKGAYNSEAGFNVYGLGGFGMLLIKATNEFTTRVDTAQYELIPYVLPGAKNIVRLTADVGLGVETQLGGGIYLYTDVRTWIQSTRFRSLYLYNQAVPRVVVLSGGLRILFD